MTKRYVCNFCIPKYYKIRDNRSVRADASPSDIRYLACLQASGFPPQQFSVRYATIPFITVKFAA